MNDEIFFDRSDEFSFDGSVSAGCPPAFGTHGFQTTSRDYSRGAQIVLQPGGTTVASNAQGD